ncbi:ABC transporter transmembrane domain-containing protein [Chitinophaga vietnamensis]|uniref:ABC transporter transmembrane domain-containing protein n=1 Tax=Chitinophaga vietnamensis TaxID=2593957 RepID=UPI0011781B12|nr:ABC transporter ATP-binding protein [Chitinophaga vietnamensis]
MKHWDIIKSHFKRRVIACFAIVLLGVINSCITVLLSLSIGVYYEMLSQHHSNKSRLLHQLHIELPHHPTIFFPVFGAVIICKLILHFLETYYSEMIALTISLSLQKKLFRHQVRMDTKDFIQKPVGKYLLRYSGDMASIRKYVSKGIFRFISDCIFMLISLAFLLSINTTTTLTTIATLIAGFLLLNSINRKLRHIQSQRRDMLSSNLHFVLGALQALTTVKAYNQEYAVIKSYKRKMEKLEHTSRRFLLLNSFNKAIVPAFLFFSLLLIFIGHMPYTAGQNNPDPARMFIPFIILVILMFPTYKRFLGVSSIWQAGNIAFLKIYSILNLPLEEYGEDKMEYQPVKGIIEFRDVSFSYSDRETILNNLNFQCGPGAINQLHGNYKSTILKLILGIYTPDSGSILFDGSDAKGLLKKSFRHHIAFISDKAPLYGNTISKCLFLKTDAGARQRAVELLRSLHFSNDNSNDIIDLDTGIGENASHLSGSQYKKLLVARALLSDKKIILIDDLPKSFDDKIREKIDVFLDQLKENRTIIVA